MGTTSQKLTYLNDTKTLLKYGINSIGGNITSQTTFRNYVTQLENIYQNLPKVSGTGSNISLSPTKKGRITSQINGDTFQQTYTGKNLLEDTIITTATEKNGITATPVYENGLLQYINFNGTATKNTYFNISRQNFGETSFNSDTGGSTEYIATSDNEMLRLTYDASNNYSYFYVANGRSVSNQKAYPMIRLASVSDSNYEPYVGGPSPSPQIPQNIESGTGLQKISIKGSNIFDNSVGGTAGQYLNDSGNVSTGYVTLNYSDYIVIPENETKLYVSGMDNDLMNAPAICFYDINKTFISGERYNSRATATINIPTNAKYFRTSYRTNYTNFMIQTLDMYDINLGTIELNKIGTYQDYITGSPNNWSIVNQIGTKTYNGSNTENWIVQLKTYRIGNFDAKPFASFDADNPLLYMNYFKWGNGVATNFKYGACWYILNGTQLVVQKDENPNSTTLAEFKTWLGTHNLKAVYPLATPTTTPITDTTLINDLNNFYHAMSKNGETNISVDGSLPIILDASVLKGES